MNILILAPDSKYVDSYIVDQIKLDDLDFDKDFNSILKIDVQGYELDVLKGATAKLLDKISLIKVKFRLLNFMIGLTIGEA